MRGHGIYMLLLKAQVFEFGRATGAGDLTVKRLGTKLGAVLSKLGTPVRHGDQELARELSARN